MGANTTFTGANTSGQANTGANTTFMGANTTFMGANTSGQANTGANTTFYGSKYNFYGSKYKRGGASLLYYSHIVV